MEDEPGVDGEPVEAPLDLSIKLDEFIRFDLVTDSGRRLVGVTAGAKEQGSTAVLLIEVDEPEHRHVVDMRAALFSAQLVRTHIGDCKIGIRAAHGGGA